MLELEGHTERLAYLETSNASLHQRLDTTINELVTHRQVIVNDKGTQAQLYTGIIELKREVAHWEKHTTDAEVKSGGDDFTGNSSDILVEDERKVREAAASNKVSQESAYPLRIHGYDPETLKTWVLCPCVLGPKYACIPIEHT